MTTSSSSTQRQTATIAYEGPNAQARLLVEALECTITGRPLPDTLRPSNAVTSPTVRPFCDWVQ